MGYHHLARKPRWPENHLVIGQVVGIHIDDAIITDGKVDVLKFNPVARLGYMDYTAVEDVFPLARPQ